jgi:hypothetical protein
MTVLGLVFAIKAGDVRWMVLSLPFSLILLWAGRYGPTGYRLAPDGLHVERRAGPVVIAYRAIQRVDRQARPVNGITIFGCKGVFGRFGRFWNMQTGAFRLYASNANEMVWLTTSDGLVGISPDRPDVFVERLRARLALL